MHIMTRWVRVCVCACMIGNFSPTLSSRYYFSHSCCFCFRAIRGKGCIEKTHTIRHTKKYFSTHTQVLPLSCSWPSLRFNWLLAGPNPTNTNTQARTHFLSQEKRQAEKRQNDGIDDWRGGTEEEIGKGGNFPISH